MSESESTSQEDADNYSPVPVTGNLCYIYVIREKDTDYYKVGFTVNPSKRLGDLGTGNPRKLIFKRIKKVDDKKWEKYVQNKLKVYSSTQGGGIEWFQIPIQHKHIIYDVFNEVPYANLPEHSVGEE